MKVRINNIGAEPTAYLGEGSEGSEYNLSIVKYHPNQYYGMLEQYLKDGWRDIGTHLYTSKPCHCTISKESFLNEESNYVIAFLKYDKDSQSTHLTSVADRLLYIEEDEKKDFFEVYKIADRMIIEKVEKDEKQKDYY